MEISTQSFSSQAESIAQHQGWNLKVTAKGTVDGMTGKGHADLEHSWETKFGTKAETDSLKYSKLGADNDPVAIFLDLRQLHELFSPIFFQYNPADDFYSLAPVVWYKLRHSFAKYLEAFPTPTLMNYLPRKFLLRIVSIHYRKSKLLDLVTYATGPITVTVDPRESDSYRKQIGVSFDTKESGGMYVHGNVVDITAGNDGFHPGAAVATIVVSHSLSGPVKLCVETLFKLESGGRMGDQQSRKYYVSFEQGASSTTVSDEDFYIETAFSLIPD